MARKKLHQVRCSREIKVLVKQMQSEALKKGKILSEREIMDIIGKKFKEDKGISLL